MDRGTDKTNIRYHVYLKYGMTVKEQSGMLHSSLGLQRTGHNLAIEQQQKYDTNELIYKTETDSQTKKTMYGYQKGTEGSVN